MTLSLGAVWNPPKDVAGAGHGLDDEPGALAMNQHAVTRQLEFGRNAYGLVAVLGQPARSSAYAFTTASPLSVKLRASVMRTSIN